MLSDTSCPAAQELDYFPILASYVADVDVWDGIGNRSEKNETQKCRN